MAADDGATGSDHHRDHGRRGPRIQPGRTRPLHAVLRQHRHVGTEIGTGIYGWHYSVPSVIAIAALIIAALTAWALIARPAWADDVERDSALRRLRSSLVGRAVLGALLIHLFVVLQSLASTASLRGSAPSSELGTVSVGTPFAAMSPLLGGLGQAALIAGLALWILLALSALPMRTRRHSALAAA